MGANHTIEIFIWGKNEGLAGSVGRKARGHLGAAGLEIVKITSLSPDRKVWEGAIGECLKKGQTDCILTIGGAGYSDGDDVPEVCGSLIMRSTPGIPEAVRELGTPFGPRAALFRGMAGLARNGCLIVNLPDDDAWMEASFSYLGTVLAHALDKAGGDPRDCGRDAR